MYPVSFRTTIGCVLVAIVATAACGGSADVGGGAAATDETTSMKGETPSSQGSTFVSSRYGYTVVLPGGWEATEAVEDLRPGEVPAPDDPALDRYQPGPGCEAGGCGVAEGSTVSVFVGAARAVAPDLEAYSSRFAKDLARKFPPCGKPASEEETTVDGEPALLMSWSCSDGFFVMNVLTQQDGHGFIIGWVASEGNESPDRAAFEEILGTFAFD